MKPPIEYRPSREGLQRRRAKASSTQPVMPDLKSVDEVPALSSALAGQFSHPSQFDRIAYQREYMRRYRAKKKAEK